MNRKTLVSVHLFLAAFFAPFVILIAVSGGLYLADVKGSVETRSIYQSSETSLNPQAEGLQGRVAGLLADAGVKNYSFEYVKVKGDTLYTRPTSRQHYVINLNANSLEVLEARPDFVASIVELHKGHGPGVFKQAQMVFAVGLLIVMLSGLWLGLSSPALSRRTLITSGAGTVIFLLFALL
jgi:hypothetical protein